MASQTNNHDYHLVPLSPWPFIGSVSVLIMMIGAVYWMSDLELFGAVVGPWGFIIGLIGVLYTMFGWWSDVVREAETGDHTPIVQLHHRYGMMLFIASEVMFFVAWFWAYFDAAWYADEAVQQARVAFTGGVWPPEGTEVFDPWHLPLFNTLVLLLSGTTVTWAHHALIEGDRAGVKWGLAITVLLGALFSGVQLLEYSEAAFGFSGNIYGATFFMATGFHGFHVFIGTVFLAVCLIRVLRGQLSQKQHIGFEFAAWYWHFVDVVWLFLFASIYVWGSWGATIHH